MIQVFRVNFVKCQKELLSATQCWQLEKGRLNMVTTGCSPVKQEKKPQLLLSLSGMSNVTVAGQHQNSGDRCPRAEMKFSHLVKKNPYFSYSLFKAGNQFEMQMASIVKRFTPLV